VNKTVKILMSAIIGMALVFSVNAAMDDKSIAERLKPVGKVCIEGDDCGSASAAVASGPRSGKDIYSSNCMACHSSGALGAPKLGDAAAWTAHLEKGFDAMTANAISGINAMPARGTCATCSDEEIKQTVQYIVDNSK
jgi:cytochrome c5